MRWHPMIIKWCIVLKSKSSSTYDALRKSGFVTLPSERTLFDYTNYIQKGCGFQSDTLTMLYKEISKTSHLAVSLKLKTRGENRGCGVWKINNSALKDDDYRSLIIHTIETCKRTAIRENLTSHNTWEKIKIDVREATQSFSKHKARQVKNRCIILENRLTSLHHLQDENDETHEIFKNEIINLEKELDSIYDYRAKGAQIRARAEWIEQGEKNTKFFLGLEKSRQTKKTIRKITKTDGRTLTDGTDILKEQVNYYSSLYVENKRHSKNEKLSRIDPIIQHTSTNRQAIVRSRYYDRRM